MVKWFRQLWDLIGAYRRAQADFERMVLVVNLLAGIGAGFFLGEMLDRVVRLRPPWNSLFVALFVTLFALALAYSAWAVTAHKRRLDARHRAYMALLDHVNPERLAQSAMEEQRAEEKLQ